jgi:acyl-CoA reductase-like NAD-dependent aldehyde dehydrogenase
VDNNFSDSTLEVINPGTGKIVGKVKLTTTAQLDEMLGRSSKIFSYWKQESISSRSLLITKFRKKLISRVDDLVNTICDETGKKSFEALLEIFTSMDHMNHTIRLSKKVLKIQSRNSGFLKYKRARVTYEPFGIAGIISPWNYPLILSLSPVVEALLAGNCVILKPSEHTPLTTAILKKAWDSLGNYNDVFQVIYGEGDLGQHLVSSEKTDVICFTGSTNIGRIIARECAAKLKPAILELGGKDPMIVLGDAHLNRAVKAAVWGGMSNAGQTCISVENIFVQQSIYSDFCNQISKQVKSMSAGPQKKNHIGPITISAGLKKINRQLDELPASIKKVEGVSEDISRFVAPTVVFDPPDDSLICNEETFGPIITVTPFDTIEDAVKKANSTGYGLSASVFTRNKKTAREVAASLNSGSVVINDVLTGFGMADLPFGGKGISGLGRVHGKEGLLAFSHVKAITENRITFSGEPWWYETSGKIEILLKKFIRLWYG